MLNWGGGEVLNWGGGAEVLNWGGGLRCSIGEGVGGLRCSIGEGG